MAATDYELLLYRRLKAILEAHAPIATDTASPTYVKPGNRIWYDGTREDPELAQRGPPAEYPRWALEPAGHTEEFYDVRQRYVDGSVSATPASLNRKVVLTFNFLLRVTHRDLRLTMNSPLEREILRALRNSNAKLSVPTTPMTNGYDWVRGWGIGGVGRQMGAVENDNTSSQRMQSTIPIGVSAVFNSADLLAE